MVKYLRKHFPARKVNNAMNLIDGFLKFRRWARRDEKSERILKAFREGLEKAR